MLTIPHSRLSHANLSVYIITHLHESPVFVLKLRDATEHTHAHIHTPHLGTHSMSTYSCVHTTRTHTHILPTQKWG